MTRIDGRGMRRLTNNEVEDGFPSFSSNGKSLFFHRVIGKHKQLFMLDLVSETETQLTFGDYSSAHAHQSPDGDNIVFDAEEGGDRNIFKMSLKTRTISQLTDAPGRDGYPKWSPDGADQRKFQVIHDHEEL
jgi:TolB protein